jgi:Zn-dependent metalloprotease
MRKLGLWAFALVAVAGFGAGPASADEGPAIEPLAPKHVSVERVGQPALAASADAIKVTFGVLAEKKALFKLRDPELELAPVRQRIDDIGMTHTRFQQMTHGVPVAGAELAAHYDRGGHLTSIDSNYIPDLDDLDVNPSLVEVDARAIARAHAALRSSVDALDLDAAEGSLVVHAPHGGTSPRLAYEFTVRAMTAASPAIWVVTVDAKTGDVLHAYDNLQTVAGKGVGVLGDEKTFQVTSDGSGSFTLVDSAAAVHIETRTAGGQKVQGKVLVSSDAFRWDTDVTGAGSAVDAHYNAGWVSQYYKQSHDRNAIDGKGGALVSTVHYGTGYQNAAWDGTGMLYGDGGEGIYPPSVALDVVGHEFTHGVTERTSALKYENQSGALNEAISDIFAAFIEHSVTPNDTDNWTIGEKALKSGGALRDMRDPGAVDQAQPAHMSQFINTQQDNGGVHANSGIINNAAFLMTAGGTNPVSGMKVDKGIGWAKSQELWYRANTEYFLKTTDFGQAAQALLEAANDVELTDDEKQAVIQAFVATGIIDAESGLPTLAATESHTQKRRRLVITQSSTCSATSRPVSAGGFGVAVAALAGFAWRRRRKS